jgi:ankyrin repeat protein
MISVFAAPKRGRFLTARKLTPRTPQSSCVFEQYEHEHPLLEAIADGDIESIRRQIDQDLTVLSLTRDTKGNTCAHVAASLGRLSEFEFLVDLEPSLLAATNEVRSTPAHHAAEAGEVAILRAIHTRAPGLLTARGALGASPMHLAAARNQLSAVLLLDECGADSFNPAAAPLLTLCDRRGSTVLHYAASHDSLDVLVWAAARQPALILATNDHGDTAAHCAARVDAAEALRAMVERCPAVIAACNAQGLRPIDVAGRACRDVLARLHAAAEAEAMAAGPPLPAAPPPPEDPPSESAPLPAALSPAASPPAGAGPRVHWLLRAADSPPAPGAV